MSLKLSLEQVKKDLAKLKGHQVVLFGSYVSGKATSRSDIDVGVISGIPDPDKNKEIFFNLLGKASDRYDVKVFELLPLEVKATLMDNYLVLFGDALEVSEYFYHFRKLWDDVRHRYYANQFTSVDEKMAALGMV